MHILAGLCLVTAALPAVKERAADPLPSGALARLGTTRLRYSEPVWHLCYSPSGATLAVGVATPTFHVAVSICNASTGKQQGCRVHHVGDIWQVCSSRSGQMAVCDGGGTHVTLSDLSTGKKGAAFPLPADNGADKISVSCLQLSPQGRFLAVARLAITVYDTATGKMVQRFGESIDEGIGPMSFSADGRLLAVALSNGQLRIWDWARRKCLYETRRPLIEVLAFAPKGTGLAVGARDGSLSMIDAQTGRILWCIEKKSPVQALVFSPDGRILAAGGKDGTLTCYASSTGNRIRFWKAHKNGSMVLAFHPNGKRLASGGSDGVVRIWETLTGRDLVPLPGHKQSVTEIACSPDGNYLLSASCDETVCLWDLRQGRQLWSAATNSLRQSPVFSANGKACAWLRMGRPDWFRLKDKQRRSSPSLAQYSAISLSPDGKSVVCLGPRGVVDAWQPLVNKLTRVHRHTEPGWLGAVGILSTQAATAAWAMGHDMIGLYSLGRHKEFEIHTGYPGRCNVFCLNPEGTLLLAHYETGPARALRVVVWDLLAKKPLAEIPGGLDIKGAAFSRTGRLFAVHDGRQIRVCETASGALVREVDAGKARPCSMTFLPDSRRLVSGNDDTTILVWDIAPEANTLNSKVELNRLWQGLATQDAKLAYRDLWALADVPSRAVAFLAQKMRPIARVSPGRLKKLIADLDDESFDVRQGATVELGRLGFAAADSLRNALNREWSPECKKRMRHLLTQLDASSRSPAFLRQIRAIELLEHLETKEAKELLKRIADGVSEAPLTRQARESLARLALRRQ
jgi:WD40 repeat protein